MVSAGGSMQQHTPVFGDQCGTRRIQLDELDHAGAANHQFGVKILGRRFS